MRSNKTSAWIDEHVHLFSCVHKNVSCLHPAAAGLQLYNLAPDHMSGSCGRSTVSKQQRRLHESTRIYESPAETKGPAVRWPLCSNSNGFDPLSVWDCVCCRPSKAANFRQQFLGVTEVETWVCTMLKASSHLCSVIWGVTVETTGQQHDQVTVLSWTQSNVYQGCRELLHLHQNLILCSMNCDWLISELQLSSCCLCTKIVYTDIQINTQVNTGCDVSSAR